jgi:hypothetical protein
MSSHAYFIKELKNLALDYMNLYFYDKDLYSGGSISTRLLKSPEYISAVLNTLMTEGTDEAWGVLGSPTKEEIKKVEQGLGIFKNTEHIISILNQCADVEVPKCFAPGILLMHLELCEGVKTI